MPDHIPDSPDLALSLDGVALGYGDFTVLQDINMAVQAGQVVAVMGGSGSGKTTLLRAATGQLPALRGQVRVFGTDIGQANGDPVQARGRCMCDLCPQGGL